jgi:hypothetical protein
VGGRGRPPLHEPFPEWASQIKNLNFLLLALFDSKKIFR